jgi:hypothetical protein
MRHLFTAAAVAALLMIATPASAGPPAGFETTRIDQIGGEIGNESTRPALSRTGLLVAFASRATNLVDGDDNDARDIFVKHRDTGAITQVSVSSTGVMADEDSNLPSIDGSGAYVVFESFATNLVPGDTNRHRDVFLHRTTTGTTTRISRAGSTQADGDSGDPVVSGNNRFVAFTSQATNLVPGDTNGVNDIFVADRITGAVSRVSVRTDGGQANGGSFHAAISHDGRYVAYSSLATNLVSSDSNGARDVFVHDRQLRTVTRVSVHSNGRQADGPSEDPAIALRGDGYVVAFTSFATNLVGNDTNGLADVYVQTSNPRRTVRASVSSAGVQSDGASSQPTLSGAGITGAQYVAFTSSAANLLDDGSDTNDDNDVYRFDLTTGQTRRFSVTTGGGQGSGDDGAVQPAIDQAGHTIAYSADFFNLVLPDAPNSDNIFLTVDNGG